MSLGRQPPPNPSPGFRNRPPIRSSCASAVARSDTSAPVASQTSAIALMKEILVARNELAATLTSSDVARSVTTTGTAGLEHRPEHLAQRSSARADPTPKTIRDGRSVSSIAWPSRRNSGFHASSASAPPGARSWSSRVSRSAVPTGTVDLPTTRQGRVRYGARPVTTDLDVAEVRAVRARQLRGAGADEVDVAELGRRRQVGGEPEPARVQGLAQELGQAGLVERHAAGGQRVDLRPVAVEGQHLVPEDGHADGMGGTEIARAEHGESRRLSGHRGLLVVGLRHHRPRVVRPARRAGLKVV